MQRKIKNDAHQVQSLNLPNEIVKVESIYYSAEANNFLKQIDQLENTKMDQWILIQLNIFWGQLMLQPKANFNNKRKYPDQYYEDKNKLEFNTQLTKNYCINFITLNVCLLIKIKSKANNANNIAAGTEPIKNAFAHWIKKLT